MNSDKINHYYYRDMRLFKRHDKPVAKTWHDVTLAQFEEVAAIVTNDETVKALRIARVIYGESGGDISFINTECPKALPQKKYWLRGRRYRLQADLGTLQMSQYIDAAAAKTTSELLAVILVPDKHQYNDGYDMGEVKAAIGDMAVTDALGLAFFLVRQLSGYITSIRKSLEMVAINQPTEAATKRHLITYLTSMERLITCLQS